MLSTDDLVGGENCFFVATGITDGELLKGVRYRAGGATTQSLVMRSKSGTIRLIEGHHQIAKLRAYSPIDSGTHARGTATTRERRSRTLVLGEALIDVVRRPDGAVAEHLGGSPANVALGLARLGHPVSLRTSIGSDDRAAS